MEAGQMLKGFIYSNWIVSNLTKRLLKENDSL